MSQVKVSGNASGTGIFEIASPNSSTNRTLTLPDATTTLVGTDATQTLTNKTINGGAITSGTAVASTSGTAIDFTSIPSWVKRVTVMFKGVSTNGTSIPVVQLGVSGTPVTSGYLGSMVSSTPTAANFVVGFGLGSNSAANIIHGSLIISLFDASTNSWVASGTIGASNAGGGWYTGGSVALSGSANMVRITTVNGTDTFDAGSINILYE